MTNPKPIDFDGLVKELEKVFKIEEYGELQDLQVRWVKITDKDWWVKIEKYGSKVRAFVSLVYPSYRLTWTLDPLTSCLIDPAGRPLILEAAMGNSILEIKLWKSR